MSKDSEHLKWIHDRIVNVYGENKNIDFLIRMRSIIDTIRKQEESFDEYITFIENQNKDE